MISLDPEEITIGDEVMYKRNFVVFTGPAPKRQKFQVNATKLRGIVIGVVRRESDNRKFVQFRLYDSSSLPSPIKQFNEWTAPACKLEKL